MRTLTVANFDAWRPLARTLLSESVPPGEVHFNDNLCQGQLFGDLEAGEPRRSPAAPTAKRVRVPKSFLNIARRVACHRDGRRFDLLYRVLWRLTHGEARWRPTMTSTV